MRLYIKNMVCNRCIAAVRNIMETHGLPLCGVQLGEVELQQEITAAQTEALRQSLQEIGFELLDDGKKKLIEKIKNIIIGQVHYNAGDDRYKLSDVLASQLHKDYSYLSHLFSEVEGITIEKYLINQKIEKVKELLVYNEATLGAIAYDLGYSSVAHLSTQFKKVTGMTPSQFKSLGSKNRKMLDQV
jgi:AraC family transcriptional regulator